MYRGPRAVRTGARDTRPGQAHWNPREKFSRPRVRLFPAETVDEYSIQSGQLAGMFVFSRVPCELGSVRESVRSFHTIRGALVGVTTPDSLWNDTPKMNATSSLQKHQRRIWEQIKRRYYRLSLFSEPHRTFLLTFIVCLEYMQIPRCSHETVLKLSKGNILHITCGGSTYIEPLLIDINSFPLIIYIGLTERVNIFEFVQSSTRTGL